MPCSTLIITIFHFKLSTSCITAAILYIIFSEAVDPDKERLGDHVSKIYDVFCEEKQKKDAPFINKCIKII